jgi:hypothetical protein
MFTAVRTPDFVRAFVYNDNVTNILVIAVVVPDYNLFHMPTLTGHYAFMLVNKLQFLSF